jgi:hypothetical protein
MEKLTLPGLLIRFALSAVLVLTSFNPSGYSFYHWAAADIRSPGPLLVVAALALLTGWIVFVRATLRSIGIGGAVLTAAFLAAVVWLVSSWGWLDPRNATVMTWVVLVALVIVLTLGLSWSLVRRRLTGQADVDDVDSR